MMTLLLMLVMQSAAPHYDVSDADIIRFQAARYDKSLLEHTRVILGWHHGVSVVVDFPCSDLCPEYTTRIVHYDLPPGPDCDRIGGVSRPVMVPAGVAVQRRMFCVPKVLGTELVREGD